MKNICVYGVGGVGGYVGGLLTHALINNSDTNITFIDRGEHLKQIKSNGLILDTEGQQLICKPHKASHSVEGCPVFDIVIIAVKSYDLDSVCNSLKSVCSENTVILPLLNGIDIHSRIRKILLKPVIIPACIYVGTYIEKPGTVKQKGGDGKIILGPDNNRSDFNYDRIKEFFDKNNVNYEWHDDPHVKIWEKFIFIASFGLVGSYSNKPVNEIIANVKLKNFVLNIMSEIFNIGCIKGIELPEDIIEKTFQKAMSFPPDTKTSYQRDYHNAAKNEGDIFGGAILRLGKEHGVYTPVTGYMYRHLHDS